jgi:hypothetical protein
MLLRKVVCDTISSSQKDASFMGFCIAWIMENKIIQCIKVFSHIFFKPCVFVKKWLDRLDTVPVFRSKNTDVIGWVIWRYHIIQTMHVETCLLHNVVSSTPRLSGIRTHYVIGERHWLDINPTTIRSRQPQLQLEYFHLAHNG